MNKVYLISEQVIRNQSLIDTNVDSMFINAAIGYALNIDLQEVIGSELYNSLINQVAISTWKSEIYHTMVDDYVIPYLIQQVMSEITMPIYAKFKNAGVVSAADNHYSQLSFNDIIKIKGEYAHKAEFLADRLVEYIEENKNAIEETKTSKKWVSYDGQPKTKCPIFFKK